MTELKACPFCGNVYGDGGIEKNKLGWRCLRCGAHLPVNDWKVMDDAEIYHPLDWNTRPLEDKLQGELDAVRKNLQIAIEAMFLRETPAQSDLSSLRQNLKEAVEEIEEKVSKPSSGGVGWFRAIRIEDILDILRSHGLIKD